MSKEQIKRNEDQRIRLEILRESCKALLAKPGNDCELLEIMVKVELALAINGATDKLYDISEQIWGVQLAVRES